MVNQFQQPYAAQILTQADIVFCLDATGSMEHCLEGVLNGMDAFVQGLSTAGTVDARFRLIAFRDYHSPECGVPWDIYDFTTASQFRRQLSRVKANGGGDEPESVLDAMYIALNSDWRSQRTHKTVVLMTDADTHPNLHERTSTAPIGGVAQIIQLIQETPHVMLFIVAPEHEAYQQIQRAAFEADRKVIFNPVPDASDDNRGLVKVNIRPLMEMISRVVSATSVDIASRFGDSFE